MQRDKRPHLKRSDFLSSAEEQSQKNGEERFLDQRVSRRQAISTGAKAAIGVAGAVIVAGAAYAAYSSLAPGAASVTSTSAASSSAATSAAGGLTFVHWHFEDAQITQYVQAFEKEFNVQVVEETLENNNYNPLLEAKFQSGEVFDMCYANGYEVPRLLKLGYLQDVESMTDIGKIKAEMYQSIIDSESTIDGKLYGLNYYWSARPIPVVNDDVLTKAGLSGQRPGTWDELWSMAAKVKDSGVVQYPVIPNWFSANYGIGWDFLGEMANVYNDPDCQKTLFAKNFSAVFDTNTQAADLLTTWATSTSKGLVDPAVFSMAGESDVVAAGNTGKYAFTTTALYDFQTMNDPSSSKIPVGMANLVPVTKQAWGMIETGIYCWPTKNHDTVKSQELIKFLGWKDPATGKRVTSPTWAEVANLGSGYPDTLKDPDVLAAYRKWLGDRTDSTLKIQDDIANAARTPWIWKSTMYTPWQDTIYPILSSVASGVLGVKDGITKMRSLADSLWKKEYGS